MSALSRPLALGFLASHGGSNLQAILDAIAAGTLPARGCVAISNNSGARALQRAQAAGVPALHLSAATHPEPDALDRAMLEALRTRGAELVVCAGYMRRVGPRVLAAYRRRVLNVHPALLPRFGGQGMYGLRVHAAVLAAGERETGVTVHLVDEVYDHGRILAQAHVPVQPGDTPEALQARVLLSEHRLYPETLRRIAVGEIDLDAE
jgi:phosphoribosylglycinamide formyltransferase-1